MRVEEIRGEDGLHALRAQWDALLGAARNCNIFQTWEWAAAWWTAYGTPGELRALAIYGEDGALRGIAPLREKEERRYGQSVRSLLFIGDGSNDSDYLDFIIADGYETQVMAAVRERLETAIGGGRVVRLNEIPEQSQSAELLANLGSAGRSLRLAQDVPCSSAPLPADWEEYLRTLRPRFRTKVRSALRRLEELPEIRFGLCRTGEQLQRLLPELFELHGRRWAADGKPGVFRWDRKREFYSALSPLLLERGWLRLSYLEWNGRTLACQYGFRHGATYYQLQEGYDPASEHWDLGIGLRAWSIRELIREGVREYDFLGGMRRHKADWGARLKYSKRLTFAAPGFRNTVFCRGPEWDAAMREAIRKIAPRPLLEWRAAFLKRRSGQRIDDGEQNGVSPARSWARRMAARIYVGCGLPGAMRPLRERYQLRPPGNGAGADAGWRKRTEPAGRILYYHRINNDGDAFFPAVSTRLLEEELQFVARHYNVVTLSELVERLSGGELARNMVAITFDDGYRDNYENAFPILRRYGLPATIFLTTGGIDERDCLWFEKLAGALQRTSRELVDVEIDRPRRFWLRSEAERLDANNRIFALLRTLPDDARRGWLSELMKRLGATTPAPGEADRMLTWEQAREMQRHGITFGGHTVTHPFLSCLSPERAAWEVGECKRRIEDELQAPVEFFAYPHGRPRDFAAWNKDLLRSAGYRAAVTTIWGVNDPSTDRLELRRGQPWEEDAALFAWKFDWYELTNG